MCNCKTCAEKGCINCKCHSKTQAGHQEFPFMVRLFETLERIEEKVDNLTEDLQKIGHILLEEIEDEE